MEERNPIVRRLDGLARPASPRPLDLRPASSRRLKAAPTPTQPIVAAGIPQPAESVGVAGDLQTVDFGSIEAYNLNYPAGTTDNGADSAETAATSTVTTNPVKPRWWHRIGRRHAVVTAATVGVALVAFVGFKAVMASSRVVTKNNGSGAPVLHGDIDPTKLKGEGDGRINILLLGVGGDGHDGGNLSDTIMVASIDPVNKTVAMLSIPRDLYVKIPGYSYGKINAANGYGGPDLAKSVVGNILDLPIHYYVQLDFAGFQQAVNAVGGVTVNNQTKLYDTEYPCDNGRGYCPFSLAAGVQQLDAKTALKYARCRHGSCGNDFGRAARQQELLVALRQKSMEASTLTNPLKLTGLIDSVGDHVRTDMQPNEWEKLALIVKDIDPAKATSRVLDDTPTGLLIDGSGTFPGAGSILLPKAGAFVYGDIQELAHSIFIDSYLKKENAAVEIQNGTGRGGLGASIAKQLTAYNYNIVNVTTADQPADASVIIDYSGGKKPYTVKYLQSRFNARVEQSTQRPTTTNSTQPQPDIVIVVGNDYKTVSTTSRP